MYVNLLMCVIKHTGTIIFETPIYKQYIYTCKIGIEIGIWASKYTLFDFECMDFERFSIGCLPYPYIS